MQLLNMDLFTMHLLLVTRQQSTRRRSLGHLQPKLCWQFGAMLLEMAKITPWGLRIEQRLREQWTMQLEARLTILEGKELGRSAGSAKRKPKIEQNDKDRKKESGGLIIAAKAYNAAANSVLGKIINPVRDDQEAAEIKKTEAPVSTNDALEEAHADVMEDKKEKKKKKRKAIDEAEVKPVIEGKPESKTEDGQKRRERRESMKNKKKLILKCRARKKRRRRRKRKVMSDNTWDLIDPAEQFWIP